MLITLEDENGQEVEFEFLDVIEFEGTEYIEIGRASCRERV